MIQPTPLPPDLADLTARAAAAAADVQARMHPDPYTDRHPILSAPGALVDARERATALERERVLLSDRRTRDLATIHQAAARLGIYDPRDRGPDANPAYRAGIVEVSDGRTDSAGLLTEAERHALLDRYRARGWTPWRPAWLRDTGVPRAKLGAARWVRALLLWLGYSDTYVDAIARKSFGVDRWEWLDYEGTTKLGQMLQIHARKVARDAPTPRTDTAAARGAVSQALLDRRRAKAALAAAGDDADRLTAQRQIAAAEATLSTLGIDIAAVDARRTRRPPKRAGGTP